MWWFVGGERVEGALNRSRTGVRWCETTLKKRDISEKKKIYQLQIRWNMDNEPPTTMSSGRHFLWKIKKWLTPGKRQEATTVNGFLNDWERRRMITANPVQTLQTSRRHLMDRAWYIIIYRYGQNVWLILLQFYFVVVTCCRWVLIQFQRRIL